MSEKSDSQIWDAVLSGDSRAFGTLFDRHRDRVFWHARRSVDNTADAEDVTALAFLELWKRRSGVRIVDDSVLPWLLVTTGNITNNTNRTRRRHRAFLARLPAPEVQPDVAIDVDTALDLRSDTAGLQHQLTQLPPKDRHLLTLTVLEGFSLLEASDAVGISYSAAKMRMSRMRARLGAAIPQLPRNEKGVIS